MDNNREHQTIQELKAVIAANDRELAALREVQDKLLTTFPEFFRFIGQLNYGQAVEELQNTGTNAEATNKEVAREDRSSGTSQVKEAAGEDDMKSDGAPESTD